MQIKIIIINILILSIHVVALGLSSETEQMRSVLPVIKNIAETYPNDSEIQLGTGLIFDLCKPPNCSYKDYYFKAIQIDKGNVAARVQFCMKEVQGYIAKRADSIDILSQMIEKSRDKNLSQIIIPNNNFLYNLIPAAQKGSVSFDTAKEQLGDNLAQEASVVLFLIDDYAAYDPNNSLYNYLRAHFYFEMGQSDKSLKEIRSGSIKPFLNFYYKELSRARDKVLSCAEIPQDKKDLFKYTICKEEFLETEIWQKIILPSAIIYQSKGEQDKALNLFLMGKKLAKQIREQPVSSGYRYYKTISDSMENNAIHRIQSLQKQ